MDDRTLGQRMADNASRIIGSWKFIIVFNALVALWVFGNSSLFHPIDPYPYTFLNLIFSWIAGVQAPIIMIAQNRQEAISHRTIEEISGMARATYEIGLAMKDLLIENNELLEEHINDDA